MGQLFSGHGRKKPNGSMATWTPPPPRAPAPREPISVPSVDHPLMKIESRVSGARHDPRPSGHSFDAELEVAEVDDRGRPQHPWVARAQKLSRSNVVFRSRRMCYTGREIILAIHLIDCTPVGLYGRVRSCDYDGEGQYVVDVDLITLPNRPELQAWIDQLAA